MPFLIRYVLCDYIRSYRYIPQVSIYIIWIGVFYTYVPNPIMDSYAITCMFLYFLSAWLSVSLFNTEDSIQHQITILHAGGVAKVYISKIISTWIITILLSIFAVVYPIIFDMFDKPVQFLHIFLSLLSHMTLSLLGILIAALFSKSLVIRTMDSWGGVSLLLILSVSYNGIEAKLPSILHPILWILPPFSKVFSNLNLGDNIHFSFQIALPFVWVYVYCLFMIMILFFILKKKRDF